MQRFLWEGNTGWVPHSTGVFHHSHYREVQIQQRGKVCWVKQRPNQTWWKKMELRGQLQKRRGLHIVWKVSDFPLNTSVHANSTRQQGLGWEPVKAKMAVLETMHAKIRLELMKGKPKNSTTTALLKGNPTGIPGKPQWYFARIRLILQ